MNKYIQKFRQGRAIKIMKKGDIFTNEYGTQYQSLGNHRFAIYKTPSEKQDLSTKTPEEVKKGFLAGDISASDYLAYQLASKPQSAVVDTTNVEPDTTVKSVVDISVPAIETPKVETPDATVTPRPYSRKDWDKEAETLGEFLSELNAIDGIKAFYDTGLIGEGREAIKEIQRRLKDADLYDGEVDGKFWTGTKNALKEAVRQGRLNSDMTIQRFTGNRDTMNFGGVWQKRNSIPYEPYTYVQYNGEPYYIGSDYTATKKIPKTNTQTEKNNSNRNSSYSGPIFDLKDLAQHRYKRVSQKWWDYMKEKDKYYTTKNGTHFYVSNLNRKYEYSPQIKQWIELQRDYK